MLIKILSNLMGCRVWILSRPRQLSVNMSMKGNGFGVNGKCEGFPVSASSDYGSTSVFCGGFWWSEREKRPRINLGLSIFGN